MSLPDSGPIAQRAAQDAIQNVGVKEDGPPYNNHGKFVRLYLASVGLDEGNPWCAAFVSFRLHRAAFEINAELPSGFPKSGLADDWAQWGKEHGRWFSADSGITPQKGDLCLFYIASEHGIHHVGIVIEAGSDTFTSVEGNTYDEGAAVRDGYCVAIRHRSMASLGEYGGFVRMP